MRSILESAGYEVVVADDGFAALECMASEDPDLILLDVRMPGMTGIEVCRRVREFSTIPIIILTALAEEVDKVRGLDAGADDYLTKPFGAQELLARVRAMLRRVAYAEIPSQDGVVRTGDLEINLLSQQVTIAGQTIGLTPTEFQVLAKLAERPGHVCAPADLLVHVWGEASVDDGHLLRQVIYRLRQKLEDDPSAPCYVLNRPGLGYYLANVD
jgi:DNA-binding response OmpR family regulator